MKVATVVLAVVSLAGYAAAVSSPYTQCAKNEVLVATPPCCEPTCDCDCEHVTCQQMLVYQPTCVCMKGFVRLNGYCVPKEHCPAPPTQPPCQTHPPSCGCGQTPCHCPTTPKPHPPKHEEPSCECGHNPCKCVQHVPHETTHKPYHPKPSCGCGHTPCQCPTTPKPHPPKHEEPSYECGHNPCKCVQHVPVTHKPYHPKPSCGCGQTPCQCPTTPKPCPPKHEEPSCECGHNPCKCVQHVPHETTPKPYHPKPSCGCGQTPCHCETTPKPTTTPAPTCAPCEELVFVQTCCEPTCDNDCSDVHCNPLLLVEEPTCACRPGLVRYQGHCVEPSTCPKSASRYRLYVPKTVSCACNSH